MDIVVSRKEKMKRLFDRLILPTRYFIRNRAEEVKNEINNSSIECKDALMSIELERRNDEQKAVRSDYRELKLWIEKRTPRAMPRMVEIHLTDHCNLNCKGCAHYSPVAKEKYVEIETLRRDLVRLSELYDGVVQEIHLLGGEPLLHPKTIEIAVFARKVFPYASIKLVTNGILLGKQNESFFRMCKDNNIEITPTKYPINVDYKALEIVAKKSGVNYHYYNDGEIEKTLWKDVLDLSGHQDVEKSFTFCHRANNCTQLNDGKIYPCPIAAYAYVLNDRFGEVLQLSKRDYIDIYSVSSADEISKFLAHSIPFCRYCNIGARTTGHPWETSERKIEEWT